MTPDGGESPSVVHGPSLRASLVLFALFLVTAVVLGLSLPERYPIRFDAAGHPTRWAEGPGMWILLVALCCVSFGQGVVFQLFLVRDPDSPLLNVPYRERFRELPGARKARVLRRVNRLLGLLNSSLVLTFLLLLVLVHGSANAPGTGIGPGALVALGALVGAMVVVPLAEVVLLRRVIRRKLREEGLWEPASGDPGHRTSAM